mgnify:CR=1 FL=1|jgi:Protein of unknown function (DUF1312).
MGTLFRMMKRWDWFIIGALIVLSFVPVWIFGIARAGEADKGGFIAIVSVDHQEVKRIRLDHAADQTFTVEDGDGGYNTIEVQHGKIRVKGANCSDQVCVRTGFISEPGETIVCLPHKVVIEIKGMEQSEDGLIISS